MYPLAWAWWCPDHVSRARLSTCSWTGNPVTFEKSTYISGAALEYIKPQYCYGVMSTRHGSQRERIWRREDRIKLDRRRLNDLHNPKYRSCVDSQSESERGTLNLTSNDFWRGPRNDGDRAVALKFLGQRRQHHQLHQLSHRDIIVTQRDVKETLSNPKVEDQSILPRLGWQKAINDAVYW